jgi:hypothetical protein
MSSDTTYATMQRQYLPTIAELIDRLTIVMLKSIYIPENRVAYLKERNAILNDIGVCLAGHSHTGYYVHWPVVLQAVAAIMLANKTIWDNESVARTGGSKQDHLLRFTHSINGVRNTAKNYIARSFGERVDLKVDALAADLPADLGNWNLFDAALDK